MAKSKHKKGKNKKKIMNQNTGWYRNKWVLISVAVVAVLGIILTLCLTGVIPIQSLINGPTGESEMQSQTPKSYNSPIPMVIDVNKKYTAFIKTAKGDLVLELYPKDAPVTVNSFVSLVRKGFYNGLTFHRIVPNFVVQGGDPKGDGTGGPGYQFQNEISQRRHITGTLSMAHSSAPNSNGSQFFICLEPQPSLDGSYSVFGQLTQGMDVLKKLVIGDKMTEVTITEND